MIEEITKTETLTVFEISDANLIIDKNSLLINKVNKELCNILSYQESELLNSSIENILPMRISSSINDEFNNILKEKDPFIVKKVWLKKSDSSIVLVDVHIITSDANEIYLKVITNDINSKLKIDINRVKENEISELGAVDYAIGEDIIYISKNTADLLNLDNRVSNVDLSTFTNSVIESDRIKLIEFFDKLNNNKIDKNLDSIIITSQISNQQLILKFKVVQNLYNKPIRLVAIMKRK